MKVKRIILSVLAMAALSLSIFNAGGVFMEEEITEGYRLYESVRMSSANNGGTTLSENQAYELSSFINGKLTKIWRVSAISLLFSIVVFVLAVGLLVHERKNT